MSALQQLKERQRKLQEAKKREEEDAQRKKKLELEAIQKVEALARTLPKELAIPPKPVKQRFKAQDAPKSKQPGKSGTSNQSDKPEEKKIRVAMTFEELQQAMKEKEAKKKVAEELKQKEKEMAEKMKAKGPRPPQKPKEASLFIPKSKPKSQSSQSQGSSQSQNIKKQISSSIKSEQKKDLQPLQMKKRDLQEVGDILDKKMIREDPEDWRALLRQATGYDPTRFRNQRDSDSDDMEASGFAIQAEEKRSRKLAIQEDLEADKETERMEREEKKRKRLK